ncbi:MAG TPA: 50S ribosomal protein L23 [Bacteroidales bacterium]|jgi:large subunit ribosomal protein L23|nr:50S ribosomal protein L23 [Bacteroidales bacterium]HNQ83167.1 50S ribosomal protein L23 [Bacteroidales bacterium]HOX76473.1 50S ribosomal protein L23 [Bacteroidales bacterium]HPI85280.1 50S ribosomal protein L23 [Bacteroidales bacterium]
MDIILKPIISEKMTEAGEKAVRYGFFVQKKANKLQIKKAVETLYGVQVKSVNTMNYDGDFKSRGTRSGIMVGRTAAYKKAIVTLAEGETIDFYSNI